MKRYDWRHAVARGGLALITATALLLTARAPVAAQVPEVTLHTFNAYGDGQNPQAGVIQGSDGSYYGTTALGGTNGAGTVYKVTQAGGLTTLHGFTYFDGSVPIAGLIQGRDGNLYGTTQYGGANGAGVVFQISTDGTTFNVLHSFNGSDGYNPLSSLIQASDGNLYGTTQYGGLSGNGVVFQISPDGTIFNTLHSFNGSDGAYPYGGVVQGSDGNLYGTTQQGGNNGVGVVFQMSTDGATFNVLHSFSYSDGAYPDASLIQATDGSLYSTAFRDGSGAGSVFRISTDGTSFSTVYSFGNGFFDGQNPGSGSLTLGPDGDFYGTTGNGGLYAAGDGGGVIYKLDPTSGKVAILHSFNVDDSDGGYSNADVIFGHDGNLYGTTAFAFGSVYDGGTLFSFTPSTQTLTTLYEFGEAGGSRPLSGLVQVGSSFYGVTPQGGSNDQGALYKMTLPDPNHQAAVTILHSFSGGDGSSPRGKLFLARDGKLYGTTQGGGANGFGTVFQMTLQGKLTTLHSFTNTDGQTPEGTLTQGYDGRLYGVTNQGGANGYGTIFALTVDGKLFTTLHSFNNTDGANPEAGPILGTDGRLYGTTSNGGGGSGTVFQISTDGAVFISLYSFSGPDGANPYAGVTEGPDGNLYGTTTSGGTGPSPNTNVQGTAFMLQTRLAANPPVILSFAAHKARVGSVIAVHGIRLDNATVSINGITQMVTANTTSILQFKIAHGTTSGLITVTTANGTTTTTTPITITH
jgi:uncharacterized repeat protein (TIGR03803 family)